MHLQQLFLGAGTKLWNASARNRAQVCGSMPSHLSFSPLPAWRWANMLHHFLVVSRELAPLCEGLVWYFTAWGPLFVKHGKHHARLSQCVPRYLLCSWQRPNVCWKEVNDREMSDLGIVCPQAKFFPNPHLGAGLWGFLSFQISGFYYYLILTNVTLDTLILLRGSCCLWAQSCSLFKEFCH